MLKEIKLSEIDCNAFDMWGENWSLATSGDEKNYNTMTISWGSLGKLWFEDVATIYVRPSRYTYEFMEKNDYFTVSFFFEKNREDLTYLGKNSGRDGDKIAKTSLEPVFLDNTVAFSQADYVIVCRKVHAVDFKREQFIDKNVEAVYKDDNIHRQYTGVIEKVYKNIN